MEKKEEQKEKLLEKVKQIPGERYTVQTEQIPKNNGIVLTAFVIREEGHRAAPVIYIDGILERIASGRATFQEAAGEIAHKFRESYWEGYESFTAGLTKELVLQKAEYRVVNYEANREQLAGMPHRRILDLAAVYQIVLEEGEYGRTSMAADCQLLKIFGISDGEIDGAAKKNTEEKGFCVQPLSAVLDELLGAERPEAEVLWQLWVVSNNDGLYGASALLYDSCFEGLAQDLGSDLYVIPASIHEVLALPVPQGEEGGPERLKEMVKEVNTSEILEEEVLSNNVYRYSKDRHMLELL